MQKALITLAAALFVSATVIPAAMAESPAEKSVREEARDMEKDAKHDAHEVDKGEHHSAEEIDKGIDPVSYTHLRAHET